MLCKLNLQYEIVKAKIQMLRQLYGKAWRYKEITTYSLIVLIFLILIHSQFKRQQQHIQIFQYNIVQLSRDTTLQSKHISINQFDIFAIQDWSKSNVWAIFKSVGYQNLEKTKKQSDMKTDKVGQHDKLKINNEKKPSKEFHSKTSGQISPSSILSSETKLQTQNTNINPPSSPTSTGMANKANSKQAKAPKMPKLPTFAAGSRTGIDPKRRQQWFKFKQLKNMPLSSQMAQQQKQYYEQNYNISDYSQLPFCVVIPSYNNVENQRYIHNINSILQQDYSNYHIIFIDDASTDKTGENLQNLAKSHQISDQKLKIIINKQRTMAMPNIYRVAHQFCKSYELLVIIDGDDELLGKQVFKFFNAVFQEYDIWLAYSNFLTFRGSLGYSRPFSQYIIKSNKFRNGPFTISHLRVFYTKLFTLINQADLKDQQGKWFRAANDVAMYLPILQMVHTRLAYFPQITYLYNSNTGLNNHKTKVREQKDNQKKVKKKNPYKQLQALLTQKELSQQKSNLNRKIPLKNQNIPETIGVQKFGWQE